MTFEHHLKLLRQLIMWLSQESFGGRGNNQCKSSDVHLRLEGMEGSVAREYELGEKGGNEVTQIM